MRFLLLVALAAAGAAVVPAYAATGARLNVYPLGDSITLGWAAAGTGPRVQTAPGGYRGTLDQLLAEANISHQFVGTSYRNSTPAMDARGQSAHDGHTGYRIDQVSTDLTGLAGGKTDDGGYWLTGTSEHAAIVPDVVVIHLGTNDITQQFDPSYRYPTSTKLVNYADSRQRGRFIADMTVRLRSLVEKIFTLRPQARIVLSDIVPINVPTLSVVAHDDIAAVVSLVRYESGRHRQIVFADVWSRFNRTVNGQTELIPGLLSTDGVHPSAAGYDVMARVYLNAIRQVI